MNIDDICVAGLVLQGMQYNCAFVNRLGQGGMAVASRGDAREDTGPSCTAMEAVDESLVRIYFILVFWQIYLHVCLQTLSFLRPDRFFR